MTDEAEAAREYERLRAELAEFVLGVLAERMAAGEEPKLSQALIDAIDRRVDEAVAARLAKTGAREPERTSRRASEPAAVRRAEPDSWLTKGRIAAVVVALFVGAAVAFLVLRMLPAGPTNTTTITNFQTYAPDAPTENEANGQAPAPTNEAIAVPPADQPQQP